jgi:hypothetical protein
MQFCSEPNCPGIAKTGAYCDAHQNSAARTSQRAARHPNEKWYSHRAWRGVYGVRNYKLRRNSVCEYVETDGTKCKCKAVDVHHIDGSWKETGGWEGWILFIGGRGTLEDPTPNLMSLCKAHHAKITMESIKEGTAVSACKSQ